MDSPFKGGVVESCRAIVEATRPLLASDDPGSAIDALMSVLMFVVWTNATDRRALMTQVAEKMALVAAQTPEGEAPDADGATPGAEETS